MFRKNLQRSLGTRETWMKRKKMSTFTIELASFDKNGTSTLVNQPTMMIPTNHTKVEGSR
jgi:hypothetical protein